MFFFISYMMKNLPQSICGKRRSYQQQNVVEFFAVFHQLTKQLKRGSGILKTIRLRGLLDRQLAPIYSYGGGHKNLKRPMMGFIVPENIVKFV